MTGELKIYDKQTDGTWNWSDAYEKYGLTLCGNSLDQLCMPAGMKSYVTNESRLEDGKHIVIGNPKLDSRDVTLTFTIQGSDKAQFYERIDAFTQRLQAGKVSLSVAGLNKEIDQNTTPMFVYNLVYTKCTTYAMSKDRTLCKMVVKLTEPNPTNRKINEEWYK